MAILQTLAEADDPVSFSELRDRVGVSDSGQFNYHLGKLDGHFVEAAEKGYQLRQPGRWVVGALLTGAVTHDPTVDRATVDFDCLVGRQSSSITVKAESNSSVPSVPERMVNQDSILRLKVTTDTAIWGR